MINAKISLAALQVGTFLISLVLLFRTGPDFFSAAPLEVLETERNLSTDIDQKSCPDQVECAKFPDFDALAIKHGTDKHEHGYAPGYQRYLPLAASTVKNRPIRFLEIGLGCGQSYGPGHSVPLWKDFLPKGAQISILEFDAQCANQWYKDTDQKDVKLFLGSQDDPVLLRKAVEEAGPFDVIVDDGSHHVKHQRASFENLFPTLPSGGVYFMEDVQTSYFSWTDGAALENQKQTALTMVLQIAANLFHGRPEFQQGSPSPPKDDPVVVKTYDYILSMDIHDTMVIFVRK